MKRLPSAARIGLAVAAVAVGGFVVRAKVAMQATSSDAASSVAPAAELLRDDAAIDVATCDDTAGTITARRPASIAGDRNAPRSLDMAAAALIESHDFLPMGELREQLFRVPHPIPFDAAKADAAALAPPAIYQRALPGVFVVGRVYKCDKCPNWHLNVGSGFAIARDGLIVTNFHVADQSEESAKTLAVADSTGKVYPVREILAASRVHDLAVVRIDAQLEPLALAERAEVGSPAFVLGHPGRRYYTFTAGMVSRAYEGIWANAPVPLIAITAEYGQGSSGGPVMDDRGRVIGIVTRTAPIYATGDDGSNQYPQMIERQCIPVESLHKLLAGELPGSTRTTRPATKPASRPTTEPAATPTVR